MESPSRNKVLALENLQRLSLEVRARTKALLQRRKTDPTDLVTIIISTYNFSAALRCAIESVLMQTHQEFELLVIGDGCTDDSEEVVKSFCDPRITWFNLPENNGSQYAPNNFALARAKGTFVAYLGHDDIWAPSHLSTGLAAMRTQDADLSCAVAILYGPPESGFMGAIGLFPEDTYTLRYHCPPPAVMHRLDVVDRVGLWRSPREAEIGTDFDFLARCYREGIKIVPTRKPTVFKFHTTSRRDAYRRKDVSDQQRTLAALRADADGFVRATLVSVIQCALEDRFIRIEAPSRPDERAALDAASSASRWMRFKGARPRHPTATANFADGPYRFFVDEEFVGYEWHLPEESPVHGRYRWSGPSRVSMIPLPIRLDSPATLRMLIVHALDPDVLSALVIRFNGRELPRTITPDEFGTSVIEADLVPEPGGEQQELTIEVVRTIRPFDAHGSSDRRWLGVAVGWIELSAPTNPARPKKNTV
jgi:glycosyltransferase involved in cell wall biosynthesis